MCKEAVVVCCEVLSQLLPGRTEDNRKKPRSGRTYGLLSETGARNLRNTKYDCYSHRHNIRS
jgi:hypothetical protein